MRHSSWSMEFSVGSSALCKGLPYERRFHSRTSLLPAIEALKKDLEYIQTGRRGKWLTSHKYILGTQGEKMKPDAKKPKCDFDESNYLTFLNNHLYTLRNPLLLRQKRLLKSDQQLRSPDTLPCNHQDHP